MYLAEKLRNEAIQFPCKGLQKDTFGELIERMEENIRGKYDRKSSDSSS